jgi:hypothetical protein
MTFRNYYKGCQKVNNIQEFEKSKLGNKGFINAVFTTSNWYLLLPPPPHPHPPTH